MTRFDPKHDSLTLSSLSSSVIVLTGGASGIGAATVRQLHSQGAKIIFGDTNSAASDALVASLTPHNDNVHFLKTDVRSYADNLALFNLALSEYGRVDHALAIAGTVEKPGWFDPRPGIAGVQHAPDTDNLVIDVNLKGVLYFAHIACSYLAHGNDGRSDRSLTLLSSVAGFLESPGLFAYQASKHGVLGLMRSLRQYVPTVFPGLRVNAICPSMTDTGMVVGIREQWIAEGNAVNTPEDVAGVLIAVCCAGPGTRGIWYDEKDAEGVRQRKAAGALDWEGKHGGGLNGRALLVVGGQVWDTEEGLDRTMELWLGKHPTQMLEKGQQALGDGSSWVKGQD